MPTPEEKTLVLTVGLPRSGKSTWARRQRVPVVNPDSIRIALYGSAFQAPGERMVWTLAHYMVEALFLAGHHTVILDATNTTLARRDEWKVGGWDTVKFKHFGTSKEACLLRAGQNEMLKVVIENMAGGFQKLGADEALLEVEELWETKNVDA